MKMLPLVYQLNPFSRGKNGKYWIRTNDGLHTVNCNMKLTCGGVEGGWMQVVDVDMNQDNACPGAWQSITSPRRLCVGGVDAGCDSAHFSTNGVTFDHICGQTKSYQKGFPDAFSTIQSINEPYADGISITLGSPRQHVWTYTVTASDDFNYKSSNCPCAQVPGTPPPAFVKDDYYCESGTTGTTVHANFYLSDPLWDGDGCPDSSGCCALLGMPWFYRRIPTRVSKDIEV